MMHCPHCQASLPVSFWKIPPGKTRCPDCGSELVFQFPAGKHVAYFTLVFFFAFLFLLFLTPGMALLFLSPAGKDGWGPWPSPWVWFVSAAIFLLLGRCLITVFRLRQGRYRLFSGADPAKPGRALTLTRAAVGLVAGLILALPVFAVWGFNKQLTLLASAHCWGPQRSAGQSELCLKAANLMLGMQSDPNFGYYFEEGEDGVFGGLPTPLNTALESRHWAMVHYLLSRGADVNSNRDGRYPIFHALRQPEIFELLVTRGARTDVLDPMGRNLVWHAAILTPADNRMVKLLLDAGNDLNRPDPAGVTPFLLACRNWDVGLVRTVVERGANLNYRDLNRRSAVHFAAQNRDPRVLRFLAEEGLSLTDPDRDGHSPLHFAAAYLRVKNMKFLLDRGVPVDPVDRRGATPLWVVVDRGHLESARLLLEHGANPSHAGRFGWTPLHSALRGTDVFKDGAREFNPKLVELLIHSGADVHARAVSWESREARLRNQPADPAAGRPEEGAPGGLARDWTPLHEAALRGFEEGARRLLDAGADPNVLTLDQRTPMSIAQQQGHQALLELLESRGGKISLTFP